MKYKVMVEEVVLYEVAVEAANEDEAANMAEDLIVNSEDPNQYFIALIERDCTATEDS